MTKRHPVNIEASIHERLFTLSKEKGEVFQLCLIRYALERFLYRLGKSEHANKFVLKGAMLFSIWTEKPHRPTKDIDLLKYGEDSTEALIAILREICQKPVQPDGLEFDSTSIRVEDIREEEEYHGKRVRLLGFLGKAKIPIQVDIGFGDVVTPETAVIEYPTILDLPAPRIQIYSKESVVSEKLQALVALGIINSRMKDFYDLRIMGQQFIFEGLTLVKAIQVTFERRRTEIPESEPLGLTREFATDELKIEQWRAFLNRTGLGGSTLRLSDVIGEVRTFLYPPLEAAAKGARFFTIWEPGGPWREKT